MKTVISLIFLTSIIIIGSVFSNPYQEENPIITQEVSDGFYMPQKLEYSKSILEGLTSNNFEQIKIAVKGLENTLEKQKTFQIKDDIHFCYLASYEKSLKKLKASVETKNADLVTYRYTQLTTNCVDCHNHLRTLK